MPLKTAAALLVLLVSSAAFAQTLTVDGCNIRRGTFCVNMNLNGAELPGVNLANSQFSRSRLAGAHLAGALGDDEYEAARRAGSALDGDAAVEHALRAL